MSRPARSLVAPAFAVQAMSLTDLAVVDRIERDIYEFPWTTGNFADSLAAGYDGWLFRCDRLVLGYALLMWAPDEVHLLNLSVARQYQQQGLGRQMLYWLIDNTSSRGACRIMLEVRPSNLIAQHLYQSSGFQQIGLRKRYYPAADGKREDALVLLLDTGTHGSHE